MHGGKLPSQMHLNIVQAKTNCKLHYVREKTFSILNLLLFSEGNTINDKTSMSLRKQCIQRTKLAISRKPFVRIKNRKRGKTTTKTLKY